ncbi:sodium:proton antiporter [Bacillus sp. FJAT-18017]|uniref:Na+/H+ antiporter family protein n=1 Tax=Bacillus sp. FJAT-18017 TaxID=1705566 RepID=UPI0006B01F25|nr:Na+/H+ antiporter NhaC family protein [Bacillus sp. FJAT-18017]ALC89269.1 sodium:proton antiporter [Bacillus sp. FJAT-18017]
MALLNPVVLSVLTLTILSLFRVHVIFALVVSTIVAGIAAGLPLNETISTLIGGMGGQAETALSYILLGIFAAMIALTGITDVLVQYLLRVIKEKKYFLLFLIAGLTCLSGTLIPVHIAFIPILIPPLLILFDKLRIDRRAVASALTFGLKTPYMVLPIGYGLIFHGIIAAEMKNNGMPINMSDVPFAMMLPGIGMIIGLIIAILFSYKKPRNYNFVELKKVDKSMEETAVGVENRDKLNGNDKKLYVFTLIAIVTAFVLQLAFGSMVVGAIGGITILFLSRVVPLNTGDKVVQEGMVMMGAIAFIMLIASGYANVLKETGAVQEFVSNASSILDGSSKTIAALVLLLVGLFITMGIGTSFGTVPIIAAVYVPLCAALGFSTLATIALIGTAGALGDAGSPASDSTLGPTAGLNADGQHDHIWDTCVPTFIHYNIPLLIFGTIAAIVL